MTMTNNKPRKATRKGVKNKPRIQNVVIPSACPCCHSTKRKKYNGVVREMIHEGELNGVKYNRIQWKRTECLDCGQHRTDRIHELVMS